MKKFTITMLFIQCLLTVKLDAQSWRFPDCSDLSVVEIEQDEDDPNLALVTLFNSCDTCHTHVYTGMILYLNNETIAIDEALDTKPSPPNNGTFQYRLIKEVDFEITQDITYELSGLCEDIPVNLDFTNGIKDLKDQLEITVYPNPSTTAERLYISSNHVLQKLRLLNLQGQLIQEWDYPVRYLELNSVNLGIYVLEIETFVGKVYKKLIVE